MTADKDYRCMSDWYLLHCKGRQEARAKQHIENQGYTTCCPMVSLEKRIRGKRQVVSEPLFPNYLFIEIDEDNANFNAIRSTRGVNNFVRFGGVPSKVPEGVVQHFLALEEAQNSDTPVETLFKAGAAVEITEGPFAGLAAVYQLNKGEERCLVLLDMMGKQQQLEIEEARLRKL